MRKAIHLLTTASKTAAVVLLAGCALVATGCGTQKNGTPDAGVDPMFAICAKNPLDPSTCKCKNGLECAGGVSANQYNWLCVSSQCHPICQNDSDCHALSSFDATYSKYVCDDAQCLPPACASNSECGSGNFCLDGQCQPAPASSGVASCTVLPVNAVVHQGSTTAFTLLAADSSHKTVAYQGDATWTVDDTANSTGATVSGSSITGTLTGGATTGQLEVKATIGGTACAPATVVNYANAPSGKTQVVVEDLGSHRPVSGATVFVGANSNTTDSNGIALIDGADGSAQTISVFDADYAYLTMVGVTGNDLIAYLKPSSNNATLTGTMKDTDFDGLSDIQGTVHIALFGGSIPGNLIDLQLTSLVGDMVPTTIDLGGNSQKISLPQGTVIGLGTQMFKKDYAVTLPVGMRSVWGLGGNAQFQDVTAALGPILSGGTSNINVGSVLAGILPLLGKLESGVATGVDATAEATPQQPMDITGKVPLDTLQRLRATVTLPDLPKYTASDGTTQTELSAAIVLAGALNDPQGMVPLGLTGGMDSGCSASTPACTGKVDAGGDGLNAGQLSMRFAPRHGGLETSPFLSLALAADLSKLSTSASGSGSGSGSSSSGGTILSGLVQFPQNLTYSTTTPNDITFSGSFMGIPNPALDEGSRTFTLATGVDGAAFYRLDIGGTKGEGEWSIYLPADTSKWGTTAGSFTIPVPPSPAVDYFLPNGKDSTGADNTANPQFLVQSVSLNGGSGSLTYEGVMDFNSNNMDDLTTQINAFSVRQIER